MLFQQTTPYDGKERFWICTPSRLLTTATNIEEVGFKRYVECEQKLQHEQSTEEGI